MKPTLFTNAQELKAMEDIFYIDGGEITEVHEDLQKELISKLETKTDSCVEFFNCCDANIQEAKNNIERMKEFIEKEERKKEDFKKYIEFCMTVAGVERFVGNFFSIKKQKGKKQVIVKDINQIPIEYVKFVADKRLLAQAIKAGESIEGVDYIVGKPTLKIGVKSKKD